MCKNGGCNCSYESPTTNDTICVHHPGVPIFHEGMKYWSCCNKKTADFSSFLNQKGCTEGSHKWTEPVCRYFLLLIIVFVFHITETGIG